MTLFYLQRLRLQFFSFLTILPFFFCLPLQISATPFKEKKHILFILNNQSQTVRESDIEKIINHYVDQSQFEYTISYSKYRNHAFELAQEALKNRVDIVAAVGGNSMVNEIGKALVGSKAALAIIPVGTGSGLARHLRISTDFAQAIQGLNKSQPIRIDTIKINDQTFLGAGGFGFDALMAKKFSRLERRGFSFYVKAALREFSIYQPTDYELIVDGVSMKRTAFIICFANSNQYGNNFIIAPEARLDDGLLDLVIIKNITYLAIPQFLYRFKRGTINHSNYVETKQFKELILRQPHIEVHVDGDPMIFKDEIKIGIAPSSLTVLAPP